MEKNFETLDGEDWFYEGIAGEKVQQKCWRQHCCQGASIYCTRAPKYIVFRISIWFIKQFKFATR